MPDAKREYQNFTIITFLLKMMSWVDLESRILAASKYIFKTSGKVFDLYLLINYLLYMFKCDEGRSNKEFKDF